MTKNGRFLYSAFSGFTPADTMEFFENEGVKLKTERGNRVFPVSDRAVDIVDALWGAAKKSGVKFVNGRAIDIICTENIVSKVKLENGQEISADAIILATGGKSYSATGSNGDGYVLAQKLGHTITDILPSLVPLKIHEGFCSYLTGLSLKNVTLSVIEEGKKKPVFSELGEMLFTHFGVSGPLVLSASAHMRKIGKTPYKLLIDLKPALSLEQLDKRIQRDFSENINKNFGNALDKLLPQKLISVIVNLSGISSETKVNQITKEERQNLCRILKEFTLHPTDFCSIEEAVVTSGGVCVREINPANMQSKLINGLYFAGEIIDVDAYTGGFNLQIAFSTGNLAGGSIQ